MNIKVRVTSYKCKPKKLCIKEYVLGKNLMFKFWKSILQTQIFKRLQGKTYPLSHSNTFSLDYQVNSILL